MSYVTKRDGVKEMVHFDKITERINRLINPTELQGLDLNWLDLKRETQYLDPILVAQKVVANLFSGITTEMLDIESAEICVNLSTTHPLYGNLGGRILVSNLHKKTLNNFSSKMTLLKDSLDPEWYMWVMTNSEELDKIVNYNLDYVYDYFGFKTLEKSYLLKLNGLIVERPQDMLLRTAVTLQMGNMEMIKKTYDYMSLGYYTHASPTLYNAGTHRMQCSSCFLMGTSDDLSSIAETWNSCAQISKWAGGIGLHVSNIRGKDSIIKGTGGRSNGIVPFLKVFNEIARWIDQGGRRPGSIAVYLEPHHPDIFDFIELRKNFGSETERARDLFLALWVSDLFMKQVEADGDWYLMSADECPGLPDVYGEEYESLYWKYVEEKKYRKKVSARKLWVAIIESQIETGMPYITYKDSVNRKSNQKNIGTIKSSNLCVDGNTKIFTSKGYTSIKTLEDQETEVWNGSEWSKVTVKKTGINKNLIRVKLSNGAYLDCTPEHKFYIIKNYHSTTYTEVMAKDLKLGDKLIKYDLPKPIELDKPEEFKYPYTHGFFCGDGTTYDNYSETIKYPKLYLYDKKKELLPHIVYTHMTENIKCNRINLVLPKDIAPKFTIPLNSSINDKLRWLEGYSDADGTIARNGTNESLQICSINKKFLLDVRLMLHTLGIESKVTVCREPCQNLLPDGKGGKQLYDCKKAYRLLVSSSGLYNLSKLGYKPKRLVFSERIPQRNAEQFTQILSIKKSYENVDTYCFTEPLKHMGMFNGILTGQCNEVIQYSDDKEYAVCNLASIALKPFIDMHKFDNEEYIIYSKPDCKYCNFAKTYLENNNVKYIEVPFSNENLTELKQLLNRSSDSITFPQIFLNTGSAPKYIGGWSELYKYTGGKFNWDKLYNTSYLATVNLNQVIDINYYPVPQTKFSNVRHRPIGLGIQGMADALVLLRVPFDSEDAVMFNSQVMETIYIASMTASNDMAQTRYEDMKTLISYFATSEQSYPEYYDSSMTLSDTDMNRLYHKLRPNKWELSKNPDSTTLGAYSSFDGSPFSEGKFQFDLWNEMTETKVVPVFNNKWKQLRKDVIKYGTRNSLLTALMPTASTSQILGNNECFEFFTNNIYTRKTQAGSFVIVNKYLVNDMLRIGMWDKNMKDKIIASNGSIQTMDDVPPEFKALYKTIWEIKQVWVLKGAAARQPFVDQTQSMNIFMGEPDYQRLGSSHFWAWKNGLKTGIYYLRTKPSADAIKFTIDPKLVKAANEAKDCDTCSA